MPTLALATALCLGVAGCTGDDDPSGQGDTTPAATEPVADGDQPDTGEATVADAGLELGPVLDELPLPGSATPLGTPDTEGQAISQAFTVGGVAAASDVIDDSYLGSLEAAGWSVQGEMEQVDDGMAATFRRDDVELLLVAQDAPPDGPDGALLNVALTAVE